MIKDMPEDIVTRNPVQSTACYGQRLVGKWHCPTLIIIIIICVVVVDAIVVAIIIAACVR